MLNSGIKIKLFVEFGEPTRKALIMDAAPEHRKAWMFSLYYLVRDIIVSIAAFGGAFLWQISPAVNLLTAFAFGLLGALYFLVFGEELKTAVMSGNIEPRKGEERS